MVVVGDEVGGGGAALGGVKRWPYLSRRAVVRKLLQRSVWRVRWLLPDGCRAGTGDKQMANTGGIVSAAVGGDGAFDGRTQVHEAVTGQALALMWNMSRGPALA